MEKIKVHTIKWDRVIYPKACPFGDTVLAIHCMFCEYIVGKVKYPNPRGCEVDCRHPEWDKVFHDMKGIYHTIKIKRVGNEED
ncbi:unnamed protein product [marine sediment metagenome]|uniref:Uncharacterized protein n=1 Tax=marine sediment metagenome TaxID=412755 RepID=X1C5K1_9ZZZZ